MSFSKSKSRSSSLPPLRNHDRSTGLPSTESPIMEPVGEITNNETMNERLTTLESLIRSLIPNLPNLPIEGNVTVTMSPSTSVEPVADVTAPTISPINELRLVSRRNYNTTSNSVMKTFKGNKITVECKDSIAKISMVRGALSTACLRNMLDGHRTQPI